MVPVLLLLLLAAPAFGEANLAQTASRFWSQPLALPAEADLVSLEPGSDDERFVYTIRRRFSQDSFTEEWVSNHATTTLTFRADGRLVSEHHQNQFRKTGIDVTVNESRTLVRTVLTQDGKVKSDKTTGLNAGIALREELNHLVTQAWRTGVHDKILCQSLSPDGGLVGDFQVVFRPTADPTSVSNLYTYPSEFRAALSHGPYIVADMSLRGIASFFFPHHFYLVYIAKGDVLEWVGYFGEDPKRPVFQFTPK